MHQILKIGNFKSFGKEQSIRLAPITLIFGQNSVGKSSIIQSLLLLNQSFKNDDASKNFELSTKGDNFDLGMPKNYFHKSDTTKILNISIEGNITFRIASPGTSTSDFRRFLEEQFSRIDIKLSYKQENNINFHDPVKLVGIEYKIKDINGENQKIISILKSNSVDNEFLLKNSLSAKVLASYLIEYKKFFKNIINLKSNANKKEPSVEELAKILLDTKFGYVGFSSRGLPQPLFDDKKGNILENLSFFWTAAFDSLNSPIIQIFSNIQHIAGLRNSPQRYYSLSNARTYVGKNGENTATLLYKQEKNIKVINTWFKLLEIPYEISVSPINDNLAGSLLIIKLLDLRNKTELTPSDVGLGVSQVLPLLVQGLADSSRSKSNFTPTRIRCVEQPELHLHPKLQANLADFFIDTTKKNNGLRWILETHSEALILRLQKRIREGKLKPEEVSINYVNSVKGGYSVLRELRIDNEGDFIDEWPDGFFEESFKERFY